MTTKKTTQKKPEPSATLDIALDEARNRISHIGRDSRNEHFKFDYASGDNMLAACRKVLSDCGLLVTLDTVEHFEIAGRLLQGCRFNVKHIESGTERPQLFTCPVVGGADDKASFACNTGIWKYYLRGLLMLPMGDFDEPCAREDDFDRGAAIKQVKNLYEERDTEWVAAVVNWVDSVVPEKMTNEQLKTICERARK